MADAEHMKAWQCIGCGRLEAQQTCIGVCQDRPVDLVYASEYDAAVAEAGRLRERLASLESLLRKIALTSPRAGQWEASYRAMQQQARSLLEPLTSASSRP